MIYLEDLPDTVEDWFNFLSDSCGGRIWGDEMLCVTRLTTDSREAAPGHLFFALKGERFDGHDFVASVAAAGAAGAVVSRWVELPPPYTDFAQIIVRDVGIAYGEAARAWRLLNDELGVIAVAGSNGKTTTTQMIASILKTQWGDRAHSTRGNLNNLVGVPKTLLELQVNAEAAVIEAGMNHPGEMGLLARWIAPSVAVVTNAQREHQEFLSGVRETAYENGLLIAALRDPGIAVFPKADPCADVWASMAAAKNVSTITFGFEEDWAKELEAEAQAGENVIPTPYTSRVMGRTLPDGRLMIFGDHLPDMEVKLAVEGRHNQLNALAAAAA
ncbi:Mur ligase family protein, partial [Sutterella parvirubra]